MLYNYYGHRFWVRYWGPGLLCQAVTLWLVNRGMAVHQGRPVKQVCSWKETTWYEHHAVRIKSRARDTQLIGGVRSSLTIWLASGWKHWHTSGSRKKIWGKKKSSLWVYVSPSISQTYNKLCTPFKNKMREIYFYKEVCLVSLIEVHSLSLIMFLVGSMRSTQQLVLTQCKVFSYCLLTDQFNVSV